MKIKWNAKVKGDADGIKLGVLEKGSVVNNRA